MVLWWEFLVVISENVDFLKFKDLRHTESQYKSHRNLLVCMPSVPGAWVGLHTTKSHLWFELVDLPLESIPRRWLPFHGVR